MKLWQASLTAMIDTTIRVTAETKEEAQEIAHNYMMGDDAGAMVIDTLFVNELAKDTIVIYPMSEDDSADDNYGWSINGTYNFDGVCESYQSDIGGENEQ